MHDILNEQEGMTAKEGRGETSPILANRGKEYT